MKNKNSDSQKIDDILEIVQFIKDNAAMKDDLKSLATKVSLMESRMNQGFNSLSSELESIREELGEVKKELKAISQRDFQDSTALSHDYLGLGRKIIKIETRLKQLELAR